jgi:hypothetical protein
MIAHNLCKVHGIQLILQRHVISLVKLKHQTFAQNKISNKLPIENLATHEKIDMIWQMLKDDGSTTYKFVEITQLAMKHFKFIYKEESQMTIV